MFATGDNATESPVAPVPPRYQWLKRFLKLGGLLLVGLLLLRWWWGWEAHRRLQAEIDRIVARGEPIFPEDFDPPEEIPDDQNAALALIKAAGLLTTTAEQDKIISDSYGKLATLTPDEWVLIADFEEKNREALSLVRQTRSMSGVDWGLRIRSPALNFILPRLGAQRQLSKALCCVAAYRHATGNDYAAIELIGDLFRLSDLMDQMPTLVSHLVAIGVAGLTVGPIEFSVHDLSVGALPAASRTQVEDLIRQLLDERSTRRGLRQAMYCERMTQLDTARQLTEGQTTLMSVGGLGAPGGPLLTQRAMMFPIQPLFELDALFMLDHMKRMVDACEHPNWTEAAPTIHALEQEAERARYELGPIRSPLIRILLPSLERAVFLHFRVIAQRRMAAIALAIRLYEIDHGRRPAELAELVPDYLEEVPRDPMDPDGETFRYLPNVEIPVLYSVGRNGIDDGGLVWDEKRKRYDRYQQDIVFLLDGVLPDSRDGD